MRSVFDRIRHALSFELIGLLLVIPASRLFFSHDPGEFGVIALAGSLMATVWVYLFNLLFDRLLLRSRGNLHKSLALRLLQAVLFEIGLLLMLLPFIAWYLQISLVDALLTDVFIAVFYVLYALVFNGLYDWLFPVDAQSTDIGRNRQNSAGERQSR